MATNESLNSDQQKDIAELRKLEANKMQSCRVIPLGYVITETEIRTAVKKN